MIELASVVPITGPSQDPVTLDRSGPIRIDCIGESNSSSAFNHGHYLLGVYLY